MSNRLDPNAEALLAMLKEFNLPPLHETSVDMARKGMKLLTPEVDPIELFSVEDIVIAANHGEIPARHYRPSNHNDLPMVVFYHGGGWVVCDLDTHDQVCRELAKQVGCVVLSVDYRLAPEHKFPAATDDAYAAFCWAYENSAALGADSDRIAVAGDSAGGNLAAVVALKARDEHGPKICHQSLWYPVTNLHELETTSYHAYAEGYRLERAGMAWFRDHYVAELSDAANPHVSPLLAEDLSNLPNSYVMTAGFDVLRDEGKQYADALAQAGVSVEYHCFDNQIHGFMNMTAQIPSAAEAFTDVAKSLKKAFNL